MNKLEQWLGTDIPPEHVARHIEHWRHLLAVVVKFSIGDFFMNDKSSA